jgi:hypothetical protein
MYEQVAQTFQLLLDESAKTELLRMVVKKDDGVMVKNLLSLTLVSTDSNSLSKDMETVMKSGASDQLLFQVFETLVKFSIDNKVSYHDYRSGGDLTCLFNDENKVVFLRALLKFDRVEFFKTYHRQIYFFHLICNRGNGEEISTMIGEYKSYKILQFLRENKLKRSESRTQLGNGYCVYEYNNCDDESTGTTILNEEQVVISMVEHTWTLKDEEELALYLSLNFHHLIPSARKMYRIIHQINTLSTLQLLSKYFPPSTNAGRLMITWQKRIDFLQWAIEDKIITIDQLIHDQKETDYASYLDSTLPYFISLVTRKLSDKSQGQLPSKNVIQELQEIFLDQLNSKHSFQVGPVFDDDDSNRGEYERRKKMKNQKMENQGKLVCPECAEDLFRAVVFNTGEQIDQFFNNDFFKNDEVVNYFLPIVKDQVSQLSTMLTTHFPSPIAHLILTNF